jgi:hypothetical protein
MFAARFARPKLRHKTKAQPSMWALFIAVYLPTHSRKKNPTICVLQRTVPSCRSNCNGWTILTCIYIYIYMLYYWPNTVKSAFHINRRSVAKLTVRLLFQYVAARNMGQSSLCWFLLRKTDLRMTRSERIIVTWFYKCFWEAGGGGEWELRRSLVNDTTI